MFELWPVNFRREVIPATQWPSNWVTVECSYSSSYYGETGKGSLWPRYRKTDDIGKVTWMTNLHPKQDQHARWHEMTEWGQPKDTVHDGGGSRRISSIPGLSDIKDIRWPQVQGCTGSSRTSTNLSITLSAHYERTKLEVANPASLQDLQCEILRGGDQ